MPYRSLDAERLIVTLTRLQTRISERFPERGIGAVCAELLEIARTDAERTERLRRPNLWIRAGTIATIAAALGALSYGIYRYRLPDVDGEAFHAFQGVEALINLAILAGAAIWFLLNLETRIRRATILADLHELRSIAHVIDMHQLTKDPIMVLGTSETGPSTPSSPVRDMSVFELTRYLDYCAEMLAMTGKLAALYLKTSRDTVVIQAVNEIEGLTTNLSSKVWQKIMITRQNRLMPPNVPEPEGGTMRLASGKDTANANCSALHPFALDGVFEEDASGD
ncbi:MAG: hypothetical protein MRY64_16265 [Hyphomonadaceae bacterium]|nr:hypothetical protein [Hyphomonadaceae bacterium]